MNVYLSSLIMNKDQLDNIILERSLCVYLSFGSMKEKTSTAFLEFPNNYL